MERHETGSGLPPCQQVIQDGARMCAKRKSQQDRLVPEQRTPQPRRFDPPNLTEARQWLRSRRQSKATFGPHAFDERQPEERRSEPAEPIHLGESETWPLCPPRRNRRRPPARHPLRQRNRERRRWCVLGSRSAQNRAGTAVPRGGMRLLHIRPGPDHCKTRFRVQTRPASHNLLRAPSQSAVVEPICSKHSAAPADSG